MKRLLSAFLMAFLFSALMIIASCDTKEPTTGILVVTVMNELGQVVVGEEVFLATSYQNLKDSVYLSSNWTDDGGEVAFMDLAPGYYWYDTGNWEDYGAVQVYAGIDHHVILWVNTPVR